jgi:hypothetical protein
MDHSGPFQGETIMLKSTLALAALALTIAAVPADAQRKYACTEADIAMMEGGLAKMDANKKNGMAQEITKAKEMMAAKDEAGCLSHMDMAYKMMPTQ